MTKRIIITATLFLVIIGGFPPLAWPQNLDTAMSVSGVWGMYGDDMKIIQYDIGFDPAAWRAHQQGDVYDFTHQPGFLQFMTVKGVTKIWANTNQNKCASLTGCTYEGTFIRPLRETLVALPDDSIVMRVSGTTKGKFTDASGNIHEQVLARLYFETNPSTDPDFDSPVSFAPGQLIIDLSPQ